MLTHTFLHLPGIGPKKERALWSLGILTWDDFECRFLAQRSMFPGDEDSAILRILDESRAALARRDFDFFAERLPKNQHYRIALTEPNATVFVDIETTGLSLFYDHTTLIGVGSAAGHHVYIKGGLIQPIVELLAEAKCIVTFNGTIFDLKFLQKEFPDIRLPKAHVDLRFFGLPFGFRGSQKSIESQLGLVRPDELRLIRGESAPLLWYRYIRGDLSAGKQLLEYNRSDIEGMKFILDTIFQRLLSTTGVSKFYSAAPFFRGSGAPHSTPDRMDAAQIQVPPYQGTIGPHVTYPELVTDARSRSLRVVGIDLTGSEKRPSGWCLLVGNRATTKVLSSNRELINETLAAQPDIVSIDSPLSLPTGRRRVSNDDPGRNKFGIMRECERTLKKRGVNVYPCLIDSMQNLTARGIRLARRLRSVGVPVIESYPGAAQDIMGIPRKRASLEYLKEGLGEFGITGEFLKATVTHDEVDAVTAAVVGAFFWSGRFEALGNNEEEYLIVPDLRVSADHWRRRLVIGISGPIAAGKTAGGEFLKTVGFSYGRYSQVLKRILEGRGVKATRGALQKFGKTVHRNPGQRWLSRQLVLGFPHDRDLVIDGLRFPEDHAYLVESFGPAFIHIHVTARDSLRRRRYVKDGYTVVEFERASRHSVEEKVPKRAILARAHLVNVGSRQSYESELRRIVRNCRRMWRLNMRKVKAPKVTEDSAVN